MNCKNCDKDLKPADNYCNYCGAKIINERITFNHLMSDLISSLGWDNQFWSTLRDLLFRPGLVFEKYLNGTRKKYSNPFTFFAIVTTITVLIIGFYTNEMIEASTNGNLTQSEIYSNSLSDNTINDNARQQGDTNYSKDSQDFTKKMVSFMIKYYYYLSFLLLPFYTFIAFLVFGKPNNFAEHLLINSYILGLLGIISLFLFVLSLITKITEIYFIGQYVVTLLYYPYAYKNYRNYSLKQLIVKILKFCLILIIVLIALFLIGVLVGIIISAINK